MNKHSNKKKKKKSKQIKFSNKLGKRKLLYLDLNLSAEKIKKVATKVRAQKKFNSKKIVNMKDQNLLREVAQEVPQWDLVLRMKMMRL